MFLISNNILPVLNGFKGSFRLLKNKADHQIFCLPLYQNFQNAVCSSFEPFIFSSVNRKQQAGKIFRPAALKASQAYSSVKLELSTF